jgi:hypothetical protein
MIEAEIFQLERGAAQLDRPAIVIHHLIGKRRIRVVEHGKALFGTPVRDDSGARILKGLAACYMVVMMMAVDQELDGPVGDLLDLGDIVLPASRSAIRDRIGRDHSIFGHDEHRLMVSVAEDVDVVGTLDLRSLDLRSLCLLGQRGRCGPDQGQGGRHCCESNPRIFVPPSFIGSRARRRNATWRKYNMA